MIEPGEMKRDFFLIETILWQLQANRTHAVAEFPLLERHLERLKRSAAVFSFPFPDETIREVMQALSARLAAGAGTEKGAGNRTKRYKVRCTLDSSGRFEITDVEQLQGIRTPVKVDISPETVDPGDIYLYHKTSRRKLFEKERRRLGKGLFDTIFQNTRDEITQGTITNIFLDTGSGMLLTPAMDCGLLPGVLRQKLLEEGRAEEAVLKKEDLMEAEALYVGNSVRGLLKTEPASVQK